MVLSTTEISLRMLDVLTHTRIKKVAYISHFICQLLLLQRINKEILNGPRGSRALVGERLTKSSSSIIWRVFQMPGLDSANQQHCCSSKFPSYTHTDIRYCNVQSNSVAEGNLLLTFKASQIPSDVLKPARSAGQQQRLVDGTTATRDGKGGTNKLEIQTRFLEKVYGSCWLAAPCALSNIHSIWEDQREGKRERQGIITIIL